MRGAIRGALAAALILAVAPLSAAEGPALTPDQVVGLLASMHPDYGRYIGSVRYGATRLRPASIYAGLVRRGGRDPRDPDDGPLTGRGASNDLIIYADTFEPWRSQAWRLLVMDHEYFHARHLARGFALPVVGFGEPGADGSYYEALGWAYVLRRAAAGVYGDLAPREVAEAESLYREHYEGFHRFVMRRQPAAWAHYGRFLPEPAVILTSAAPDPTADASPAAGPATR